MAGMTIPRLLTLIAAFALLLTPLRMFGPVEAAAAPAASHHAMAPGHCSEAPKDRQGHPSRSPDCMTACAAIAPPAAPAAPARILIRAAMPAPARAAAFAGLHPDAETPPPRSS
jgi:hypothetical protein